MSKANSLMAALKAEAAPEEQAPQSEKPAAQKTKKPKQGRAAAATQTAKPKSPGKQTAGRYRDTTVLVGGHFPPEVLRQLRVIAAEEGTTNQALIGEALDLLFTRKGKQKISGLQG